MKRLISFIILGITFLSPIVACASNNEKHNFSYYESFARENFKLNDEDIKGLTPENFLGLTKEEMLEDYDYWWTTMKENSPLFDIAENKGLDVEETYKYYRSKIENSHSNIELVNCLREICSKLPGHKGLMPTSDVNEIYSECYERKEWAKITDDVISDRNYRLFKYFNFLYGKEDKEKIIDKMNKNVFNIKDENIDVDANITTKIIDEGKIAYIKINSFGNKYICDKTECKIKDFFEKVEDYDNIIIDITGNGGGSTRFKMYFAPLAKENRQVDSYILLKNGNQGAPFRKEAFGDMLKSIEFLPKFSELTEKDKSKFTHFVKWSREIPKFPKSIKGKAWLLVDEGVFSASESFAILCKETKYATLVGKCTSGDGKGIDPFLMKLPNSKLIYRYSGDYGINSDGSSNAEFGTEPDIISPDNETPLETCLKEIKSRNK